MRKSTHPADGLFYVDHDVLKRMLIEKCMCKEWQARMRREIRRHPDQRFIFTYKALRRLMSVYNELSAYRGIEMHNYMNFLNCTVHPTYNAHRHSDHQDRCEWYITDIMNGLLDLARRRGLVA